MSQPPIRNGKLKPPSIEEALAQAKDILTANGEGHKGALYREMLLNAIQAKEDDLDVLDLKVLNRAVAEFRYAASIFKPYRHIRKTSIFGSARTPEGDPYYELAVQTGKAVADSGYMVITGAASGIMRAGIEGAGTEKSFGANILLPFEAGPTGAFKGDPKLITFRFFFTRKVFFVMEAHACILFPGGFGTHDENFEVLTLLQTGKTPPMPVVLMELPGETYWETWDQFIRTQLLGRNYVSPEDLSFYRIAHTPQEAADVITGYYSTYNSVRRVGRTLVIRLEQELRDEEVALLNQEFPDMLVDGAIEKSGPLPQEADEPNLQANPRLVLNWDQRSPGRLNEMILRLNELGSRVPGSQGPS